MPDSTTAVQSPFHEYILPTSWTGREPYIYKDWTEPGTWETMKTAVDKYDDEMCKIWNDNLDTLLVFTGLFSASVTAFCIESFKLLSQDPSNTTNDILRVISQQLANTTASPASSFEEVAFLPATQEVQINVLYFLSLTLALSVSSVCILGKQWIREFHRDMAVSARDALRVRQARFDAFHAWKVPQILAALPVILQVALLLFFAGLLNQLWNVSDRTTAAVVSVVVALTILMVFVTTVTPAHYKGQSYHERFTPFRSTQAWMYLVSLRTMHMTLQRIFNWLFRYRGKPLPNADVFESWHDFDKIFLSEEITRSGASDEVTTIHSCLRWILKVLGHADEIESAVLWALMPQFHPPGLIRSLDQLKHYVLSKEIPTKNAIPDNIARLHYDYATLYREQHRESHGMSFVFTGNLLGATAKNALQMLAEDNPSDAQEVWDVVTEACKEIFKIYDEALTVNTSRVEWVAVHKEDAVHLLYPILKRLFNILWNSGLPPSVNLDWTGILLSLFRLIEWHPETSSPPYNLASDVISLLMPSLASKHRSVLMLCDIGDATVEVAEHSWEHAIRMFRVLDNILVDLYANADGVEGVDENNLQRWHNLRKRLIQKNKCLQPPDPHKLSDNAFPNSLTILLELDSPPPTSEKPEGVDHKEAVATAGFPEKDPAWTDYKH